VGGDGLFHYRPACNSHGEQYHTLDLFDCGPLTGMIVKPCAAAAGCLSYFLIISGASKRFPPSRLTRL